MHGDESDAPLLAPTRDGSTTRAPLFAVPRLRLRPDAATPGSDAQRAPIRKQHPVRQVASRTCAASVTAPAGALPAPSPPPETTTPPLVAPTAPTAPVRPAIDRSAAPAIEVRGLMKEYAQGKRVVDGIDISVAPGEIYGFLGPNGAGKSTTVNMLVTPLPPTGGSARIGGYDVVREGHLVRRQIGAALQSVALDPFLTPREHLRLVAALHGSSPSSSAHRVEQMLERVGLSHVADKRCGGFSGGMKRRLDLALALVHGPKVLFLDEPTTGLDPQSRAALWEEVRRLAWDEGVTVFLTTQYLEEADVLADRIGIIERGRIVAEGTPSELKAAVGSATLEVTPSDATDRAGLTSVLERFGVPVPPRAADRIAFRFHDGQPDATLFDVVRALDHAGLHVSEVRVHEPSLDDVFLTHTGRSLEGAGTK